MPSPGTDPKIHSFQDGEVGYEYVEFPPETVFLESIAINNTYKPGVGYVPALLQVKNATSGEYVYEQHV